MAFFTLVIHFAPLVEPLQSRVVFACMSEGRTKALWEDESEIGHFPIVFECKDSAKLRHGKLF